MDRKNEIEKVETSSQRSQGCKAQKGKLNTSEKRHIE
jgi:hypothetical protein